MKIYFVETYTHYPAERPVELSHDAYIMAARYQYDDSFDGFLPTGQFEIELTKLKPIEYGLDDRRYRKYYDGMVFFCEHMW